MFSGLVVLPKMSAKDFYRTMKVLEHKEKAS